MRSSPSSNSTCAEVGDSTTTIGSWPTDMGRRAAAKAISSSAARELWSGSKGDGPDPCDFVGQPGQVGSQPPDKQPPGRRDDLEDSLTYRWSDRKLLR